MWHFIVYFIMYVEKTVSIHSSLKIDKLCVQCFQLRQQHQPNLLYHWFHYSDVIMSTMASQITDILIVCSTICSGTAQRKHQKLHVTGLCEGNSPVIGEFPHKGPVMWKMFPFDDVIMRHDAMWCHNSVDLDAWWPQQPIDMRTNGCIPKYSKWLVNSLIKWEIESSSSHLGLKTRPCDLPSYST